MSSNPEDDPVIGRKWGDHYVVESKLGEGGMGAVYRLAHRSLRDKFLAIKVLNSRGAVVASAKERFDQEAHVATALGKNRVAEVFDLGQFSDGIPYIIMAYIPGQSLDDLLDYTGPLRTVTAVQIGFYIADTLTIAHAKKIIHRDIKPSNIMLTRTRENDFDVTILDWGIARARGELQVAHTATTAIAGTLGYMAPEVVRRGGVIDGRADVFSLGVLLYKILTGVQPFPALTSEEQIPAFIASRPPALGLHRPPDLDPVPRWLERIVLRALAPLAEDRPTMDGLREELRAALSRLREQPAAHPPNTDLPLSHKQGLDTGHLASTRGATEPTQLLRKTSETPSVATFPLPDTTRVLRRSTLRRRIAALSIITVLVIVGFLVVCSPRDMNMQAPSRHQALADLQDASSSIPPTDMGASGPPALDMTVRHSPPALPKKRLIKKGNCPVGLPGNPICD